MKVFTWRLNRENITTIGKLRKYNVNIEESCHFCNSEKEDMITCLKTTNFVEASRQKSSQIVKRHYIL